MKMEILLVAINAKYIHSCLAVYDLAAYCKDLPAHCAVKEYTINQQEEHILQSIYEEHADIIAFSCYLTCFWHAGLWPVLVCACLLLRVSGTILPEKNRYKELTKGKIRANIIKL